MILNLRASDHNSSVKVVYQVSVEFFSSWIILYDFDVYILNLRTFLVVFHHWAFQWSLHVQFIILLTLFWFVLHIHLICRIDHELRTYGLNFSLVGARLKFQPFFFLTNTQAVASGQHICIYAHKAKRVIDQIRHMSRNVILNYCIRL